MKFRTLVQQERRLNATGLVVPDDVVAALGGGRRAAVVVTVNGYSYRSTIMVMGGEAKLPLAQEHRAKAGVEGGQEVEVELILDTAPREVAVPEDFAAALRAAGVEKAFAELSFTYRKDHVRAIEDLKTPETRARRITASVAKFQG